MREIRKSGSEGGGTVRFLLPLSARMANALIQVRISGLPDLKAEQAKVSPYLEHLQVGAVSKLQPRFAQYLPDEAVFAGLICLSIGRQPFHQIFLQSRILQSRLRVPG